jgi:4-amino-4-deoxy-L-arabinose transferase-like glycosyltransferase
MYVSLAFGLLTHGTFSYPERANTPDVERMPGYPLLIAAVVAVTGENLLGVVLFQILLDSLSCLLVYRLGQALSRGSGPWSGLLAAVNVCMITYSHFILNDSLYLFVLMVVVLGVIEFLKKPGVSSSILLGIGFAMTAMLRPVSIYLPISLVPFCVCFFLLSPGRSSVRSFCSVLVMVLVFFVGLIPWSMRNYGHYGRWSLTAQSGEHLLQYVVPSVWEYSKGIPFIEGMKRANREFLEKMKADEIDVESLSPFEKSDLQVAMSLETLRSEPVGAVVKAWAFGMIKNLFAPGIIDLSYLLGIERPHFFYTEGTTTLERAWNFVRDMKGWFGWAVVASMVGLVLSRIVQLWGLIILFRKKPWEAGLFVLIISYFLFISGPVGYAKYRLPFEPILIVLLAIGLIDLTERWRLEERFASLSLGRRPKGQSV